MNKCKRACLMTMSHLMTTQTKKINPKSSGALMSKTTLVNQTQADFISQALASLAWILRKLRWLLLRIQWHKLRLDSTKKNLNRDIKMFRQKLFGLISAKLIRMFSDMIQEKNKRWISMDINFTICYHQALVLLLRMSLFLNWSISVQRTQLMTL